MADFEIPVKGHPWFIPHKWSRWTKEERYQERSCLKCGKVERKVLDFPPCDHEWVFKDSHEWGPLDGEGNVQVRSRQEHFKCLNCGARKVVYYTAGAAWQKILP